MNTINKLNSILKERILVIDGAMGTLIQQQQLNASDFGGEEYEGCNDYLSLTKPDVIEYIHDEYLKAGADIIETNTFGANSIVLNEYNLSDKARQINYESCIIARKCADKYSDRFVAGAMGPTSKAISVTGGITFDEMMGSYYEQALGLIEGGCDLLILETSQDTLNVKAGIVAINKACLETGKQIPFFISGSILINGTMLAGQDIEAFYTSVRYSSPFAIGMNCATGPREMKDYLQILSEISDLPTFIYPNAGLPDEFGEYSETPEEFARIVENYIDRGWINIVGGCCGTAQKHIRLLKDLVSEKKPRTVVSKPKIFVVSGIDVVTPDPNVKPLLVGERTNVQGSRRFKKMIRNGSYEKAIGVAKQQVSNGASIIDVCVEDTAVDEIEVIDSLYPKLTRAVKVPIMIDSTTPEAVEHALKYCQGKSIINSINLEGGREKLDVIIPIIKRYGASAIVGMIDEEGMAVSYDKKITTANRLYKLLTEDYSISPQDLIFDMLVFTVDSGQNPMYKGSAGATIKAIKDFKTQYPNVMTILGISNSSFGLPPAGREVLNAVFLYHCVKVGLDMAIVNPAQLKRYTSLSEEEIQLTEDLIFDRNDKTLTNFIDYYRDKEKYSTSPVKSSMTPEEAVEEAVISGDNTHLNKNIDELLKTYQPMDIINKFLMKGMDAVGDLFGEGKLIVTEVLQSAEVMKEAVSIIEPLLTAESLSEKKKILLATVKGDVHDIGKNLVNIILSSNGYDVIDIGTKVDSHTLIKAINTHKPDAIGLSGLLVKSAKQMVITAEDLNREGINIPIMVGGAAITENFVKNSVQAVYSADVFYSKNAMEGLKILKHLFNKSK